MNASKRAKEIVNKQDGKQTSERENKQENKQTKQERKQMVVSPRDKCRFGSDVYNFIVLKHGQHTSKQDSCMDM